MIEVTNKLFQPLTFQLDDGTGLHLPPRGRALVANGNVSKELRRAAQRGVISLQAPAVADTPVTTKSRTTKEG